MIRPHRFTEPRFTLLEISEMARMEYMTLSQWITRGIVQNIGTKPPKMRRTLYSIADCLTVTLISDLNRIISMRPSFAGAFVDKAQQRLAQIARAGFGDSGRHFLIGWQSDADTFSVKPFIKMPGVNWHDFEYPVVLLPI